MQRNVYVPMHYENSTATGGSAADKEGIHSMNMTNVDKTHYC